MKVGDLQYEALVTRFEGCFSGRENKTILRNRVSKMRQEEGEELKLSMRGVN